MGDYLEDIPETPSGTAEDDADSETGTVTETEESDTENISEAPSDTLDDFADAGDPEPETDENDDEDAESFEDSESDIDEAADSDSDEGADSDTSHVEESRNSETYPEKTYRPVSAPETVSGNNADYPYGSSEDASTYAAYDSGGIDSLLLVETMERQNDILCAGFMSTLFILGIILGVLIIHGFRLRRV